MTESFILLKFLLSKVSPEIDLNVGLRMRSLAKMVITAVAHDMSLQMCDTRPSRF